MSNRCIANFDANVFIVPLEGTASTLGPIVSYDSVQDPKPANYRLDELDY
jgi:IMP cyclohydrolase